MGANNRFINPYTQEQIDFLLSFKDSGKLYHEITKLFNEKFNTNKNRGAITHKCKALGYEQRAKSPTTLTDDQLEFVKQNQEGISRKELADLFNHKYNTNISYKTLKSMCIYRGLKNGNTGKFGDREYTPWNKGMSKEEIYKAMGGKEQVYKNIRNAAKHNTKYRKGDVILRHGVAYLVLKDPDGKLKYRERTTPLNRYTWEQHYGKVPEKCRIINKDGNPLNNKIENLMCVSFSSFGTLCGLNAFGLGKITEALVEVCELQSTLKDKFN